MGGAGSGRSWHLTARRSTDHELRLDVRKMHRSGLLEPGVSGVHTWRGGNSVSRIGFHVEGDERADAFRLEYAVNDVPHELRVAITWTPCHFGGARPWGRCPRCGRRIAVLYGGRTFACRECRGLAYASTREDRATRLMTKAQRIRQRLGGSANLSEPFPWKPKHMHWRTYWRLRSEAEEARAGGLLAAVGMLSSSLARDG